MCFQFRKKNRPLPQIIRKKTKKIPQKISKYRTKPLSLRPINKEQNEYTLQCILLRLLLYLLWKRGEAVILCFKATKDKIHEPHLKYKVGLFYY